MHPNVLQLEQRRFCVCEGRSLWENERRKQVHHLPVALILIVEAELYANLNRLDSEEADSHLAVDHPLHKLAVRVTAVIQEPTLIALVGGVDDLQKIPRLSVTWRVRLSTREEAQKAWRTPGDIHQVWRQEHEVHVLLLGFFHLSLRERRSRRVPSGQV